MYSTPKIDAFQVHPTIQRKADSHSLEVGAHDSAFEREADAVADQVMRMPMSGTKAQGISGLSETSIQRKCSACEEEKIQRKPSSSSAKGNSTLNPSLQGKINSTRGQGQNLDSPTRGFMESRFGRDFSNVKIHTGGYSSELNRGLNAKAFAIGSDIYFNQGQYQPNSDTGKHLLAHELAHVVQQNGGAGQIQKSGMAGNLIQRAPEDEPEWQGPPRFAHNACMTFDDGPHPSGTEVVLSALGNRHATFFITGRKIEDGGTEPINVDPEVQYKYLKIMLEKGHQIANHSLTHRPLTDKQYLAANPETVVQGYRDNVNYWKDLFEGREIKYPGFEFTRLPGQGRDYARFVEALEADSKIPHISWNYEFCPHEECSWIKEKYNDWQGVKGVKGSTNGLPPENAIILLHDHHWEGRADKFKALITKMDELGYRFGRLNKTGACE